MGAQFHPVITSFLDTVEETALLSLYRIYIKKTWQGSFWGFYSIVLNLACSYGSLINLVFLPSLCGILRLGRMTIAASFFFPRLCTFGVLCGSV